MPRSVILSKTAKDSVDSLLVYLENTWFEDIKLKFISKLEQRLSQIRIHPSVFPLSKLKPGLHKCVVTRQTSMYYTFDHEKIYVLAIFDNRQGPKKLTEKIL